MIVRHVEAGRLQHLADRPESYLAQPAEVQQFLSRLPVAWDETRFLSGYPGEQVVLARRSGTTWYVAGINGTDQEATLTVPLQRLPAGLGAVQAFFDAAAAAGEGTQAACWDIRSLPALPQSVRCAPRGGFVFVVRR